MLSEVRKAEGSRGAIGSLTWGKRIPRNGGEMTGWTTEKAVKEQTLKWILIERIVSFIGKDVRERRGAHGQHAPLGSLMS